MKYSIDYKGLVVGHHEFDFVVDGAFFRDKNADRIADARLAVNVAMEKSARQMELLLTVDGVLDVECDRCLDVFEMPLHVECPLIVKHSGDGDEQDDVDVLWISDDDSIDLEDYIYDTVCLSLPFQVVHPSIEECNQDMISRFRSVTVEEFDQMFPEVETEGTSEVGLSDENMAKLVALKQSAQNIDKK